MPFYFSCEGGGKAEGPEPEHSEWDLERELPVSLTLMGVWFVSGMRFKEIIQHLIIGCKIVNAVML